MNIVKETRIAQSSAMLSAGNRDRLISLASPLLLLLGWEVAVHAGWLDARFFPAPSKIFGTFAALVESGVLWAHTWASLTRLFWGVLLGGIPGLLLGVAMGLYILRVAFGLVRRSFNGLMDHALPKEEQEQQQHAFATNRLLQTLKQQHEELMTFYQKQVQTKRMDREQQTISVGHQDFQIQTDLINQPPTFKPV